MAAIILTEKREIIEAKKLAYEVSVKEQKWEIKPDNPSGFTLNNCQKEKFYGMIMILLLLG